jgi:hypothetical protein
MMESLRAFVIHARGNIASDSRIDSPQVDLSVRLIAFRRPPITFRASTRCIRPTPALKSTAIPLRRAIVLTEDGG